MKDQGTVFNEDDEKRFPRITLWQLLKGAIRNFARLTDCLIDWHILDLPPELVSRKEISKHPMQGKINSAEHSTSKAGEKKRARIAGPD